MAREKIGGIKIICTIVGVTAAVFIVLGGMSNDYSIGSIITLGIMGVLYGAISAPEVESKIFRHPIIWQICCSVAGSLLVAFVLQPAPEGYFLAVLIGAYIGYSAPFWIKFVTLP